MSFYRKFFLAIVIITAILVVNFFVAKNFLENIYVAISRPISMSLNAKMFEISAYFHNVLYAPQLTKAVSTLKQENAQLVASLARFNNLEEENRTLRTRLNLASDPKRQPIFANISSLKGESALSSFIIDRGSEEGVEDGLAVVTAENILAGIVTKTYQHSALVLMPQSKDLSLNVKVSGKNILARSQGNGSRALLDFVTSQDEVKIGDLIVTSGLDKISQAISIFKVSNIQPVKGNLFQEVSVVPLFHIADASKVFVIK